MLRLSVLDQSPIASGASAADAVRQTEILARRTEALGYHRYWVAEHHNTAGLAGSTPEIMVAHVAAITRRIRVGSGGVMLNHYSPLKVAENFRMLETLHPGRIDLGIGRAPGSDQETASVIRYGPMIPIERFPNQLSDLAGFLLGQWPEGHPFADIRAMPEGPRYPDPWLLGSSDQSAAYAAYFGFKFSFAQFIAGTSGAAVVEAYRENFRPSAFAPEPRANLAISVIAADTEEEAKRLARSRELWLLQAATGQRGTFPSPDEADAYPYTARDRAFIQANRNRSVVGGPQQVKERLLVLAAEYGVDEVVAVTICHDFAARLRSYELLAEVFELEPPAP